MLVLKFQNLLNQFSDNINSAKTNDMKYLPAE